MKVVVNTEAHFARGRDGVIRSPAANASYSAWTPYLAAGDSVVVVARVSDSPGTDGHPVEGLGVRVLAVPGYHGLWGTLASPLRTLRALWPVTQGSSVAYSVRLPSIIGGLLILALRLRRRDYAVELIGDPYDVLRSGIVPRPAGLLGSRVFLALTRWQCAGAMTANYVTSQALQHRYPARRADVTYSFSDVDVECKDFAESARSSSPSTPYRLVMVGTMSQVYKGHHVMIEALADMKRDGLQCLLLLAGEGRLQEALRVQVSKAGLDDEVEFLGHLGKDELLDLLRGADVFVLPSLTEGMPRALIEAMAAGLPCVASRVGGVPELLPGDWCVKPGDSNELAKAIRRLLTCEKDYVEASEANLLRAADFRGDRLGEQRSAFYGRLRRMAQSR